MLNDMLPIKIAILDSGANFRHPALKNAKINGFSFINDQLNIQTDYSDNLGHGTAIAALIHSIAPRCEMFAIKIFNDDFCYTESTLLAVMEWIAENKHFDIINISAGITQPCHLPDLFNICKKISDKGTIIISAFDNEGAISYPAAFDCVLGIDTGKFCTTRDEFEYVESDIININAHGRRQRLAWSDPDYVTGAGSSYACARVTGKVALFMENRRLNIDQVKLEFKSIAKVIHTNSSNNLQRVPLKPPIMNNVLLFPFNKEMHSIIRHSDLVTFNIIAVCHSKYSGMVGKTISEAMNDTSIIGEIANKKIHNIMNLSDDIWCNADTLILGHCGLLSQYTKGRVPIGDIIKKAIKDNKNIFSFDPLPYYREWASNIGYSGNIYWSEINHADVPQNRFGKLHRMTKPILGIFGTSSQVGKVTLQLNLRSSLLKKGYKVGQLGTEPNALLFEFDEVYHCGHNTEVTLSRCELLTYLNEMLNRIDKKDVDLIIVGGQGTVLPKTVSNTRPYFAIRMEFLYATQPDIIVLCIRYEDTVRHINNTIKTIEGVADAKVLGLVLFPFRTDEGLLGTAKNTRRISESEFSAKKKELEQEICVPVYDLSSSDNIEQLLETCIENLSP